MSRTESKYRFFSIGSYGREKVSLQRALSVCLELGVIQHEEVGILKSSGEWILAQWDVDIRRLPELGEETNVSTYIGDYHRFAVTRIYELTDRKGNMLLSANSRWVLMDTKTRSLARIHPDDLKKIDEVHEKRKVKFSRLKEPKQGEEVKFNLQRRDFDHIGHINNMVYVDYLYEAIPEELFQNYELKNIAIQYKKEGRNTDVLVVTYNVREEENRILMIASFKENGEVLALTESVWEPIGKE